VTIRLLLADDQELIRGALAVMLELEDDFEVVASVSRGDDVVWAAREHRPDVALLDIEMPGIDGLAAAWVLAQELPNCRSLILTIFGRRGDLRRAVESGALGFVVKDAPPEQLAAAIRRVAAGERVVDPALAAATLAGGVSPLTARGTGRAGRCPARRDRGGDRRQAVPLQGHRPQLPVVGDRQDRHAQPRQSRPHRGREWLALRLWQHHRAAQCEHRPGRGRSADADRRRGGQPDWRLAGSARVYRWSHARDLRIKDRRSSIAEASACWPAATPRR
jgi:two-component system response regulator DesR